MLLEVANIKQRRTSGRTVCYDRLSQVVTEKLGGTPARRPMPRPLLLVVGIGATAAILGVGATRREHTAGR